MTVEIERICYFCHSRVERKLSVAEYPEMAGVEVESPIGGLSGGFLLAGRFFCPCCEERIIHAKQESLEYRRFVRSFRAALFATQERKAPGVATQVVRLGKKASGGGAFR